MLAANDYQRFSIEQGRVTNIGERMQAKLEAIPLPDLAGLSVLDVGCDMGFWCALAMERGARRVVGIDRGREVRGDGFVDLAQRNRETISGAEFYGINLGAQWRAFGQFDVVFVFSMYHHVFAQTGDHDCIWYWLRQHVPNRGRVIWEGPTDMSDPVPAKHIPREWQCQYTEAEIFGAASKWFHVEHIGKARHEQTRDVYQLTAKTQKRALYSGAVLPGSGGASKAWEYNDGRRVLEMEAATGMQCIPGSLNVNIRDRDFGWHRGYLCAEISDLVDRSAGLESPWAPRRVKLYPVQANNVPAYVFRFDGEKYPDHFVELVSSARLRDFIDADESVEILQ